MKSPTISCWQEINIFSRGVSDLGCCSSSDCVPPTGINHPRRMEFINSPLLFLIGSECTFDKPVQPPWDCA
jgi:hypothetical protein